MRKRIIVSLIVLITLSLTAGLFVAAKKRAKRKAVQEAQPFEFEVNATEYAYNEYITYRIKNAPPNSPIYWSATVGGSQEWENGAFYDNYTNGNGEWSETHQLPGWLPAGHWIKQATIGGQTATTEFDLEASDVPWWYCHLTSISKCVQIAQEKGVAQVRVRNPISIGQAQTFDLNEIKQKLTVVKLTNWVAGVTVYDPQTDKIRVYDKFKAQFLHSATNPSPNVTGSYPLPPGVGSIASDEAVLIHGYGSTSVNGITVTQQPFGMRNLANAYKVYLVYRNDYNPQVIHLAVGPAGMYWIETPGGGNNYIYVNEDDNYILDFKKGYHPFIALNPTPNDPSTTVNFKIKVNDLVNILNQ